MGYLLWFFGFLFSTILAISSFVKGSESFYPWLVASIYAVLLLIQELRINILTNKKEDNKDLLDDNL
jgi:hypothetical protein